MLPFTAANPRSSLPCLPRTDPRTGMAIALLESSRRASAQSAKADSYCRLSSRMFARNEYADVFWGSSRIAASESLAPP